jgi:hypothetical protein
MSLYRPVRNRNDLLCISRAQGWRLVSKRGYHHEVAHELTLACKQ